MVNSQRIDLLISVARAYYEQGLTQEQIGSSMNLSRSQVSRYLSEAREVGVVQFRIIDLRNHVESLERDLMARFPTLRHAIIVPFFSADTRMARQVIGMACANYLESVVQPGDKVGIGCGRTIRATVAALRPHPVPNLSVIQAMGSLGHEALEIDFNELTRAAAVALSARPYYINAPAILGSGTAAELEAANPGIRDSLERARSADIYLVGIGSLDSSALYIRAGLICEADINWMREHGVIGDVCARYMDAQGRECPTPFTPRIVGIGLDDIRRARLSIGVAGGGDKVAPLLAVLRGGWINVIVTEEQTARAILRLDDESRGGARNHAGTA